MSYTYDLADRLLTRSYPNGIVQTNAFDNAGRITGLSYSTPNPPPTTNQIIQVALAYAYDRNDNKTGTGESGTLDWPQPSITDEQSSFTPAGRLINRQITETSPSNSVNSIAYHYDASGNMTNAIGDGQSWTLTYDEDNRTTSINWDCNMTAKSVTNRYDALGRRVSKTVDGVTTGYVLDLSGGMEKVLCDLDGNGNVTADYVHGPDLCYRVDATNGLICYHADAMGNVIALTDGNTNLVAQYAYTPYGRSLGSTNSLSTLISQPYTFVGSQGVQEESDIPNLYFMRARYYSADAGVFLSTDSEKHIGAGWRPVAYNYADSNPNLKIDPRGTGNWIADVVAFDVGALTDLGYQIYQQAHVNKHGWNFSPYLNGEDVFLSGLTAGAATEAAQDVGGLATGTLGTLGGVAAGALVNDAGAIIRQYADGGFKNVDVAKATLEGDLSAIDGLAAINLPKIDISVPYASTINSLEEESASTLVGVTAKSVSSVVAPQVSNGTSTIGGGISFASQTPNSFSVASSLNSHQATTPVSSTAGSTPILSSSISSGSGSHSTSTATSTQTTSSSSSTSFLNQVGSFISTVATSVGSFFSNLFGGHH